MGECLRIEYILGELRVTAETYASAVSCSNRAVIRTQGISCRAESYSCVETLCKGLVDAVGACGDAGLERLIEVADGLVQVGKQLLEDDVAAALCNVHIVCGNRAETGRNVAPGLYEVVIYHSPEGESLAQQMSHVAVTFDIAVLAQAFYGEVCPLHCGIHHVERTVVKVHLAVVGGYAVGCDLVLAVKRLG